MFHCTITSQAAALIEKITYPLQKKEEKCIYNSLWKFCKCTLGADGILLAQYVPL